MSKAKSKQRRLVCICKKEYDSKVPMIDCELCHESFHMSCVNVSANDLPTFFTWNCTGCIEARAINPDIVNEGVFQLHGRITPKGGWTTRVAVQDDLESAISSIASLSTRIDKEAYSLWSNGRILNCFSNEMLLPYFLFYQSNVQASMKQQGYRVDICFKLNPLLLKWTSCGCPVGIEGQCKHTLATLLHLRHHILLEDTNFPDAIAPTEQPQVWHVKKPLNDEPLLFSSVTITRVEQKQKMRGLGERTINFSNTLNLGNYVSDEFLKMMATDLKSEKLMIMETWESSNFLPVFPKESMEMCLAEAVFNQIGVHIPAFNYKEVYKSEIEQFPHVVQNTVEISHHDSKEVEKRTRMQSMSNLWKKQRFFRITASNFYRYLHAKDPVKVHTQLVKPFYSKATKHGKIYEERAIKVFMDTEVFSKDAHQSNIGLIVNPNYPFFGASPDYCVLENNELYLVEVKCPYACYSSKVKIKDKAKDPNFYLCYDGSQLKANPFHPAYLQIQAQLNLCNIYKAYLIVFVPPSDLEYVLVEKEDIDIVIKKLSDIWFTRLLPYFSEKFFQ